ncbi:hypothetical protein IM792_16805 [Mucilaginibacter sp. JRF]|uniref:hypothetical protein n=1 Tax=Mucilaginibacter sp. JRF TaxID=2780088 RepID=UPI00187E5264|nr:hypothetical protein [Mucilaginibacter sp. JRF]MBE9586116.1 hypothetical protein [Mucilaginibacter sp. JRF]
MKKLILITIVFFLTNLNNSYAQRPSTNPQVNKQQILATVQGFLKWYKLNRRDVDTTRLLKGGPPDSTVRTSIDWDGVERFLSKLHNSGYVTLAYLNTHREYFKWIDARLEGMKPTSELIKIDGMDINMVLDTFEPEEVLSRLNNGKIHQIASIYRKAIISYQLSPYICMLFSLTFIDKWKIDSIGYDNTHENSFGAQ